MVYNKYFNETSSQKVKDVIETVKRKVSFKNILFVLLTILLANQTFITDFSPFTFVLFGVASVFNVPLILVLISSGISLLVGGTNVMEISYILSFFIVFTLITALINIEGISKKISVFIKFIISFTAIDILFSFINNTFFTNMFANIGNVLIVAILYFIFTIGCYVLVNINKGYLYSKEESVAMIIVLSLACTVFSPIALFGYSISNILVLIVILVYGWRNGAITACAAGLISGLFLTCITNAPISYVISLAVSGLIAGIFRKFGKISVILAFIVGNVCLSYYTNNFADIYMRVSEMLIASLSLLFMPKVWELKLDHLFNQNTTLNKAYENMLDSASDAKNKIGAISNVFETLSNVDLETSPEEEQETRDIIKKYIIDYIENSCIGCKDRHSCIEENNLNLIVDYIVNKLDHNEAINTELFREDCDFSKNIIQNIYEVYNGIKITRILKRKENENSKKLSIQYKEVAKILSNVSNNVKNTPIVDNKVHVKLRDELKFYGYIVYEDEFVQDGDNIEYTFVTDILNNIDKQKKEIVTLASDILEQNVVIKLILNSSKKEKSRIKLVSVPDFEIQNVVIHDNKSGENISGDSYLIMELQDLKNLSVLSDGAGSGSMAAKGSQTVINMLEKLLESGFEEDKAVEIINSVIKLKGDDTKFSTLDAFIVNLKNAEAEFVKIGAAPTYILQDGQVTTITNTNIPLGLVKTSDYIPIAKKLNDGAIVVQVTDGVITDKMNPTDNFVTKYLKNIDATKSIKVIGDEIHKLVIKENDGKLKDDMSIIISKMKNVRK
ncbi:MAG: SpoIIE family protein phosphatase [Clostridia bacterium]|nr:SpoIIE family protein phosphatase [Clostridia bacterium]